MTSEERDKKVDALLELVEDWDIAFLIQEVRESWANQLDKLSDSELDEECKFHFDRR